MSTLKFLCDENIPDALVSCLSRLEPGMVVSFIGQPGAPPKGTKDPELLLFAEANGFTFLSRDKKTMPRHVADHLAAGHHTWGVFLLKEGYPVMEVAQYILLLWSASQAEEWRDYLGYIPD
jgi:hypothetical protein